ncbi:MAG: hypothetical protein H0T62_06730 [Parachlamydiaceae bacterium]|nr:hypothetical protein [Parachlamydiaceae bacterium]
MDEGQKKFIQNSSRLGVKIARNSLIKIIQTSLLSAFLFAGVFPLHSNITKVSEKESNEGIVAIHFGPGDDNFIAIVEESEEEISSPDKTKKELE